MSTPPRYLDQAAIARRFNLARHDLTAAMTRWPNYPAPDAFVGDSPLWLASRGEAWDRWNGDRLAVVDDVPHYVGPAAVARHLGVVRSAVSNWLARWPDVVPQPDAVVDDDRPVWLASRLPEWERWARANASAAGGARW